MAQSLGFVCVRVCISRHQYIGTQHSTSVYASHILGSSALLLPRLMNTCVVRVLGPLDAKAIVPISFVCTADHVSATALQID